MDISLPSMCMPAFCCCTAVPDKSYHLVSIISHLLRLFNTPRNQGQHFTGKRSKLWATFNEVGVAAMCGFISGNHPPGKLLRFRVSSLSLQCSTPSAAMKSCSPIFHRLLIFLIFFECSLICLGAANKPKASAFGIMKIIEGVEADRKSLCCRQPHM